MNPKFIYKPVAFLVVFILVPLYSLAQGAEIAMHRLSKDVAFIINVLTCLAAINPILLIVLFISKRNVVTLPFFISVLVAGIVGFMLVNGINQKEFLLGVFFYISASASIALIVWSKVSRKRVNKSQEKFQK